MRTDFFQDVFGAQLSTSLKWDTIALIDVVEMAALRRIRIPGEVVLEGEPTYVKLANSYIAVNVGGGPTNDKPNLFYILQPA